MVIIWSGFGFVVAVIGVLSLLLTQMASEALTSDPMFYRGHSWLVLVAMCLAALVTYGFQYLLDRRARSSEAAPANRHTLFFVPVKWWPAIFVVIGVATLFSGNR